MLLSLVARLSSTLMLFKSNDVSVIFTLVKFLMDGYPPVNVYASPDEFVIVRLVKLKVLILTGSSNVNNKTPSFISKSNWSNKGSIISGTNSSTTVAFPSAISSM